jgi:hypothetical protein
MTEIVTKCNHCNGEGVCTRGTRFPGEQSCASCLAKEHYADMRRVVVKCSICDGKGIIRLGDREN